MTIDARRLQAWVDDSGGKGSTKHMLFASVCMSAEAWALFSEQWATVLAADIPIDFFKFDHALNCTHAFRPSRMTQAQRDAKVMALVNVVNNFVVRFVPLCVDLQAFEETVAGRFPKPLNHPYFWAFDMLILGVANDVLYHAKIRERFEIIFDEQLIWAPRVKAWYPYTRKMCSVMRPDVYDMLPVDPLFRDDKENMPLQLADLLAGMTRGHLSRQLGSLDWLPDAFTNLIYEQGGLGFDRAKFEQFIESAMTYEPDEEMIRLLGEFPE